MEQLLTLATLIGPPIAVGSLLVGIMQLRRSPKPKPAPIATSLMIIGVPMRHGRDLGDWH
jgi:hypothetical protein